MENMDSVVKFKESNFVNISLVQNQIPAQALGNNNTENFSTMPIMHHESISINSVELNAATSLSDDSGLPHTTNSSISSNDSCKLGVYKFEVEVMESDGEVSQLDSLDNCSEGGMSAEIFNTLKKVPLAPIDPPPEFQDSPRSTLIRTIPKSVVTTLRRWTSSQSSFEHLRDNSGGDLLKLFESDDLSKNDCIERNYENSSHLDDCKTLKGSYAITKHLYSSDSILTSHTDSIYDEPNYITSNSLGNSFDEIESNPPVKLPPPPPPVSLIKINQTLCPYYQDHSRYFKAMPSEHDCISARKCDSTLPSDIQSNDIYFGMKRNVCHQFDNHLQGKQLHNPLNSALCCNNPGIILYSNRPHSRNSLNSRLSSSHNSLSVPSANKADDSIFITQAMSHDALLTSEISDFYNVPLDSDIYALPVDMIRSEKCFYNEVHKFSNESYLNKSDETSSKSNHRIPRSKRRRKSGDTKDTKDKQGLENKESKFTYNPILVPNIKEIGMKNVFQTKREPMHMTLNEIKQLYQSFYSNSRNEPDVIEKSGDIAADAVKLSNETLWSVSSIRSISDNSTKEKNVLNLRNDNINNNTLKTNCVNRIQMKPLQIEQKQHEMNTSNASTTNKQNFQWDKKFQFNLNLKQKFCSIFRFRRNYSRCRGRNTPKAEHNLLQRLEDNKSKFQSRALPPVPNKGDGQSDAESISLDKKTETQAFQFTTSIEKVKDYGWYWGPLSCEAAERVLSNEPDGSFIVRDSSDDHYIFSLSFKLNNCVRHVRIEQDQGTFSFGSYAKFKSQTITEFIEKAVEHSRSGRYLFFLHRRPEHGPMRVQLTNPVSRFKHVQSLQHMCRFIILKTVIRKDLVQNLPLPRRLLDYLSYKHCYAEQIESDSSQSQISGEGSI